MSNGLESHVNVGNMEVMGNADSLLKRFVDKNTSTQRTNADSRPNEESENNIGKTNMNVNENESNPSVLQEEARDDSSNRQQIDSEQQPEVHAAKLLRRKRVAGGKRIRNAHTMRKCLAEAGTSFENGVRRSKRITMRPLEYWKGERFLYDKSNPSVLEEGARNGTSGRRQIDPKQQPEFQVHAAKLLRGTRVAAEKRIRNSHPMLKSPAEAGTSFENGVRRSKRIRIRPLEHWKEKRFSYERADNKGRLDFASVKASRDAAKPRKKGHGEPGVSAARERADRGLPPPPRGASMARKAGVTGGPPVSPLERRSPPRARGDPAVVALECGQKRPREEVTMPARKSGRGLSIPGVYRSERVESYFDVEDGGLAWRKSRDLSSFDLNLSEACSDRVLAEAAASRCAQLLNICTMMESRAKKYKGGTSQVEGDLQQVKEEVAQLQELLQRSKEDVKTLKEENKKLEDKLAHEYSTGEVFLSSMPGRGYKLSIEHGAAKAAVKDFTESDRFKELCKERALSIYDDIVKDCQRILRESGRVPEEVVLLLDGVEFEARVDDDSGDGKRADAAGDDLMVDVLGDEVADEGGAENASSA